MVKVAAESLTSTPSRDKIVGAAEAVALIRPGDTVMLEGFAGQCFPEELVLSLEERFLSTGGPNGLTLLFTVAQSDRSGRGIDHLAYEGLLDRIVGAHFGLAPAIGRLCVSGAVEAYNLPQGVIAQMLRDVAAGKPGVITQVGLGTYIDPRNGGGKVNDRTTEDIVELIELNGKEYLFYHAVQANVALLRGTTADPDGNITMEREALTLEGQAAAMAVHNNGGLVVVQVERIAERGSLSPRDVKIPGALVDCVVIAPPEHHTQTFGTSYSGAFSGELRRVPISLGTGAPLDPRKVIARRAAMELKPNSVVNLGIGIPEGVASVAHEEHLLNFVTLTAEPGVIGGMPVGGLDFGSAINADAILDQPSQFDFYDGGGLDAAFLGMAQCDSTGNVNVSRFGPRLAGCGGFINISQNAKRLFFLGTFLAPSQVQIAGGKVLVNEGDAATKFVAEVEQRTFSGEFAVGRGQPVMYITERCVFVLEEEGLRLTEIAPGVDLEHDVLAHLQFTPLMADEIKQMDARIFNDEPMDLADDLLTIPLEDRFAYDDKRNMFFLNMEAMNLRSTDDVQAIYNEVDRRLSVVGHKVHMVVNYDNFVLPPHLSDEYLAAVRALADRYYQSATRYTTSSFMRLKLSEGLSNRGLAPHVFESQNEAVSWHSDHATEPAEK